MSASSPEAPLERDQLRQLGRRPSVTAVRHFFDRYASFVLSSARRRTGDVVIAHRVTAAVFFVLARRGRKLSRKTVLAGWLFRVTKLACYKFTSSSKRRRSFWPWRRRTGLAGAMEQNSVAREIDRALDRLPSRQRDAVLLRFFLDRDWPSLATALRTSEKRAQKLVDRGWKRVTRILGPLGFDPAPTAWAELSPSESQTSIGAAPGSGESFLPWDELVEASGPNPAQRLGRRVLWRLGAARWCRRVLLGGPLVVASIVAVLGTAYYLDSLSGHSHSISAFLVWSARHEAKTVPGLAQPARPWPADSAVARLSAAAIRGPEDLYRKTNVWLACLKFSGQQWRALEPEWIGPLPNFLQPDGTVLLRHPAAQRSGLAGVLGYDFHWTHADLEFGGRLFTNVAARYKGNGTYLGSLYGEKRAFKVDLNKFTKGQQLGGGDELNFNNLVNDHSCMSDALGYEFFRDAGVPAPRTAYAYLSVSMTGQFEKPLGLYVMVEPIDRPFLEEHIGSPSTPLFKPVTYDLFYYLGDDWAAYEAIYDLKTKATPKQREQLISFARLVTSAGDAEFAEQLERFLDLPAFARFLAGQVLLSNYDSLFSTGQNYYLYLDPASNKFGFIPWDLDLAWGGFFLLGTRRERELASIWHPWVGQNRFLERVMSVESFRKLYRAQIEELLSRLFVPDRLNARIDELAVSLRGPVAAESDFRRAKFEEALAERRVKWDREDGSHNRPAHQIKRFIVNRAASVRQQLDGRSEGVILERRGRAAKPRD